MLGDIRRALKLLREAEALAERLNDDRRRGLVSGYLTHSLTMLGDVDASLTSGARALEIAERLGDLRLRILTTTNLEVTHFSRGDYERVVELATDNLRVLPADWVYEYFGALPASVQDRYWLVSSLSELGRFVEATTEGAEALRLAEPTQHALTIGFACQAAARPRQLQGDWTGARSLYERLIAVLRTENVVYALPFGVAAYALTLAHLGEVSAALDQLHEGERLLERRVATGMSSRVAAGFYSLASAALVIDRHDEARGLARSHAGIRSR